LTAGQIAALVGTNSPKIAALEKAGQIPPRNKKGKFNLAKTLMAYINVQDTSLDVKKINVSGQQLGNVFGIANTSVSNHDKKGLFVRGKDNLYPLAESVQRYIQAIKDKVKENSHGDMFEAARAKKMVAAAESEELDLRKRKGSLVDISDVTDIVQAEYAVVRQRLFTIPTKAALDVFSCETAQEVQELLMSHLNEALNELKLDVSRKTSGDKNGGTEASANDKPS